MRCVSSCRVMHAMRTTRLDWILEQLRQVDAAVINTFEACMGLALPCHARKQAALPTSLGGLGFCSAELHAASAYIASRTATQKLCRTMGQSFTLEINDLDIGLAAAIGLCNAVLGSASALQRSDLDHGQVVSQRDLSRKINVAIREALIESAAPASKARLRDTGAALPAPGLQPCRPMPSTSASSIKSLLQRCGSGADCPSSARTGGAPNATNFLTKHASTPWLA